jgi:site-specific DNA-methyltransferase (adenine-specific)
VGLSPYYDEGGITIYHGRAEDVLPTLKDIDMVFTSPPYNLGVTTGGGFGHGTGYAGGKWRAAQADRGGIRYDEHHDAMPPDKYAEWQRHVLTACWNTLSDSGAIFYNHKPRVQASTLWLPLELNPELPVRQIVIWARAGGMNFMPTAYVPTHEWIIVFAKPAWRLKSKAASGVGDVWYVPQGASPHPAPFPIGLPARAIESVSPRSVLDPFCGSGTTLRAAKDAGIPGIGIESSERWCEHAALRVGQESLFGEAA